MGCPHCNHPKSQTPTMPKNKKENEVVVNHGRASKILMTLNSWKELHFVDSMVSVRVSRLRQLLDDFLKPVRDRQTEMYEAVLEEYGTMHQGKKVLLGDSPGVKIINDKAKELMEQGEIKITEKFKEKELLYRHRDPETKNVSEHHVALSSEDIEALGVDELIVLGKE